MTGLVDMPCATFCDTHHTAQAAAKQNALFLQPWDFLIKENRGRHGLLTNRAIGVSARVFDDFKRTRERVFGAREVLRLEFMSTVVWRSFV